MKRIEFKDIKELDKIMSKEAKKKANKDYKKFYLDKFKNAKPIMSFSKDKGDK